MFFIFYNNDSYEQNFETNLNTEHREAINLNGDELKEAKDTQYKSIINKNRPEEDEQLVVSEPFLVGCYVFYFY